MKFALILFASLELVSLALLAKTILVNRRYNAHEKVPVKIKNQHQKRR